MLKNRGKSIEKAIHIKGTNTRHISSVLFNINNSSNDCCDTARTKPQTSIYINKYIYIYIDIYICNKTSYPRIYSQETPLWLDALLRTLIFGSFYGNLTLSRISSLYTCMVNISEIILTFFSYLKESLIGSGTLEMIHLCFKSVAGRFIRLLNVSTSPTIGSYKCVCTYYEYKYEEKKMLIIINNI